MYILKSCINFDVKISKLFDVHNLKVSV